VYASGTSSGIQELNAHEAHDAPPILLCAHARRLTRRERKLLACLISCMSLSPILSEFLRNIDFDVPYYDPGLIIAKHLKVLPVQFCPNLVCSH